MIKNNFIAASFALVLGLCAGCEDFLNITPPSDITPESYLWDESQLASYCAARYTMLPGHANWTFGTFGDDKYTDNMAGEDYSMMFAPGQLKVGTTGGDWSFTDIFQCNYFLNTVLPRWKNGKITGTQIKVSHDIGEIYFFRAWQYFSKVRSLGDFAIIRETLPDNMEILTDASQRAPHSEVVRFIISDLDSAILLMSAISPDGGARNRLSQNAALILKSRVALYEATWLKYFKNTAFVPNGPGWPGATKDYNKNYQFKAGSIDAEISWLLDQAIDAAMKVADNVPLVTNNKILQQSASDAVNPYFNMFSDEDMSVHKEVILWRRYSLSLGITHNVPVYASRGNHDVGLTRGMVDGFLMANGLPIYDAASGYMGDDSLTLVRQGRDGRLWLFLKEPGQKNVIDASTPGSHTTYTEIIPDITAASVEQGYRTGYSIRKGLNYAAKYSGNGSGSTGCIVFRAAEAYLNYIEAYYEKNGTLDAKSTQYWQAIRTRAGLDPDFNKTIAATNLDIEATNDWGVYSSGLKVNATLYNIRRERRCELMAEGLRDMDLRRWRSMDQLITTPYHVEGFKLWGYMQKWYLVSGVSKLKYLPASGPNVSSPTISQYLRPWEIIGNEFVLNGYKWTMAHYWNPIAYQHFLITSKDNDVSTSPIYQNPGWPTTANLPPIGF